MEQAEGESQEAASNPPAGFSRQLHRACYGVAFVGIFGVLALLCFGSSGVEVTGSCVASERTTDGVRTVSISVSNAGAIRVRFAGAVELEKGFRAEVLSHPAIPFILGPGESWLLHVPVATEPNEVRLTWEPCSRSRDFLRRHAKGLARFVADEPDTLVIPVRPPYFGNDFPLRDVPFKSR